MRSFDVAFLRSFVAVADGGTLRHAAVLVARTTAAISQQMKALEATAGATLFVRAPGGRLALTAAGQGLLPYARQLVALNDAAIGHALALATQAPVRFGMPQDFALSALPGLLEAFRAEHPGVAVQAHVERNTAIAGLFDAGQLDLALLIGGARVRAERVAQCPSVWIARPGFRPPRGGALPLVLLEEPCLFRRHALAALARAGIASRIVFTSPSVAGLWAAVQGGLGVTVRMPLGLPPGVAVLPAAGWPALPGVSLQLRRGAGADGPAVQRLHTLVAAGLAQALQPAPVRRRSVRPLP